MTATPDNPFPNNSPAGVVVSDACSVPSGVEASVCSDITERQRKGIAKYGMTVAENPLPLRDWLQHAYEETLDKAIYLKRAIAEIDGRESHAIIKRNEYPDHYAGHNEWGPMWTSSPLGAFPVPAREAQGVLDEIAAKCPNVWAVIYPQNTYSGNT